MIENIFANFGQFIVFLHVAGAIILGGSLIAFVCIVLPVLNKIDDKFESYEFLFGVFERYRLLIFIIMIEILVSSIFMSIGIGFQYGNPATYIIIQTKRALWFFIIFNFIYSEFKFINAKKSFKKNELIEVKENFILISRYFIPLNIVLIFISTYFGVILRGY